MSAAVRLDIVAAALAIRPRPRPILGLGPVRIGAGASGDALSGALIRGRAAAIGARRPRSLTVALGAGDGVALVSWAARAGVAPVARGPARWIIAARTARGAHAFVPIIPGPGTAFRDKRLSVKRCERDARRRQEVFRDMFGLGKRGRAREIKRILVVEDEPLVAFDNEHVLAEAGFVVVATVDTAAAAERLIAAGGIDLVTSDIRLSGAGSGIDVARAAHAAGIPVLFVTGNCPVDAQALAAGCLAKPYSARELVAAIVAVAGHIGGTPPTRLPRGLTLFPA